MPFFPPRFVLGRLGLAGIVVAYPEQNRRWQYYQGREKYELLGTEAHGEMPEQPAADERAERAEAGDRPVEDLAFLVLQNAVHEGPILLRDYHYIGFFEDQEEENEPFAGMAEQRPGEQEESGAGEHGNGHGFFSADGGKEAAVAVDHCGHHERDAGYGVGFPGGAELVYEEGFGRRADELVAAEEEHGGKPGQENGPGHMAAPFGLKRGEKRGHDRYYPKYGRGPQWKVVHRQNGPLAGKDA